MIQVSLQFHAHQLSICLRVPSPPPSSPFEQILCSQSVFKWHPLKKCRLNQFDDSRYNRANSIQPRLPVTRLLTSLWEKHSDFNCFPILSRPSYDQTNDEFLPPHSYIIGRKLVSALRRKSNKFLVNGFLVTNEGASRY